jgi:predicted DNA-binding antitoxin AbrB/MazE fold protein
MALAKKLFPVTKTFHAVFEHGALRPLKRLRLKEKSRFLVTVYPENQWRDEFERLRRKMLVRTKHIPQKEIEAEVTKARPGARAKRPGARRTA